MRDEPRVGRGGQCGSLGLEWFDRTLSRRSFVGSAATALCALSLGLPRRASASGTSQVWALDPLSPEEEKCCGGCTACRAHAANKLFATAAVADTQRAHPGCRCRVVLLGTIDQQLYDGLFPPNGTRVSVDRRYPWVRELFDSPGSPSISPGSPSITTEPIPAPDVAELGQMAPARPTIEPLGSSGVVQLRALRFSVDAHNRRLLSVKLFVDEPVQATLLLQRASTLLAFRTVHLDSLKTFTLSIPSETKAGLATLNIRVRDRDGHTRRISRPVHIHPGLREPKHVSGSRKTPSRYAASALKPDN